MISTKTEYLLFTLINLTLRDNDEYVSSRTIAEEERIPPNYLPQLMALLTKKGWVESVRGVNGGVRLNINPEKITVRDVIRLAGDTFFVKKCISEEGCSFEREASCRLRPLWCEAQSKVEEVMEGVSIADLANSRLDDKNIDFLEA